MYKRIESQLVLIGMSKKVLAERLDMGYNTLLTKLRGEREFTLKEARQLKEIINASEPIESLFLRSA